MIVESGILLLLLVLSGFFSGIELAFFSLSEIKVKKMVAAESKNSKLVERLKRNPQKLLITILIGNNLVNIGSASFATVVATAAFGDSGVGIATGVMTFLILVFGEIAPKAFCAKHAENITRRFAKPIYALTWFLTPISWPLSKLTSLLTGGEVVDEIKFEEEIRAMAEMGAMEGEVAKGEQDMIHNIFQLNDIPVRDRMTALSGVVMYNAATTLSEIREEVTESMYSRLPVFEGDRENIVGVLHKDDALLSLGMDDEEDMELELLARKAMKIPAEMTLDKALRRIQLLHNHLAVVVDEGKRSIGIITLEDILEEVVGNIADETDLDEQFIHRVSRHEILVLGKTSIVDVNNFFNASLKGHKSVDTFLKESFDPLPSVGDPIQIGPLTFTIQKMEGDEVRVVKVTKVMA